VYPIRSVVKLHVAADGTATRTTLSGTKKRKRRVSKRWRGVDKMLRRMSRAQAVSANDYLQRHDRSNQKKRNGALRDLGKNMMRAQRKGRKALKIRFL
jgi:hypothetical protein